MPDTRQLDVLRARHGFVNFFFILRRIAVIVHAAQYQQLRFERCNSIAHIKRIDGHQVMVLRHRADLPVPFHQTLAQARFDKLHGAALKRNPFFFIRLRVFCGAQAHFVRVGRAGFGFCGYGHDQHALHLIGIIQAVLQRDRRAQRVTHQHQFFFHTLRPLSP